MQDTTFYMKTNVLQDFRICISVPLRPTFLQQIICDYGLLSIKSEAAIPSFSLKSCSENSRKFTTKTSVVVSFF